MDVVCTGNAGNTSLVVAAVAATNGKDVRQHNVSRHEDVGFLSILTRRPSWGAKIENYKAKEH